MRLNISPGVIFEELEGEAVLLRLEGGTYYKLNHSGTRIWALIQEHGETSAIEDVLISEYSLDPQVARRDVAALVEELEGQGLIAVERA